MNPAPSVNGFARKSPTRQFASLPMPMRRWLGEGIALDEVFQTLRTGRVLENYPEHRRGACCLVGGSSDAGRPLHVVCTTRNPVLIVITVYEPKPPKWPTPQERGAKL